MWLGIAAVAPAQAPGPATVSVGARIPGARPLRGDTAYYVTIVMRPGKREPSQLLTRFVEPYQEGGRKFLRSVQRFETRSGFSVDTSVAELPSLRPLTFVEHSTGGGGRSFVFAPSGIRGIVTRDDTTHRGVELENPPPVYNFIMDDELLAALPWRLGYVVAYDAYEPGDKIYHIQARVVGSESVRLAGGKAVDAWVVEQTGAMVAKFTWWIDKKTNRQLQLRVPLSGGAVLWRLRMAAPFPEIAEDPSRP